MTFLADLMDFFVKRHTKKFDAASIRRRHNETFTKFEIFF